MTRVNARPVCVSLHTGPRHCSFLATLLKCLRKANADRYGVLVCRQSVFLSAHLSRALHRSWHRHRRNAGPTVWSDTRHLPRPANPLSRRIYIPADCGHTGRREPIARLFDRRPRPPASLPKRFERTGQMDMGRGIIRLKPKRLLKGGHRLGVIFLVSESQP